MIAPTYSNQSCQDLQRGGPRSSLCESCPEPDPHRIVRLAVTDWTHGEDAAFLKNVLELGLADASFREVDRFHETLLHIAARYGAGPDILLWLINNGVNVQALNAAGQTFMHVLNPISFNGERKDIINGGTEDLPGLIFKLKSLFFDFSLRDDYGQTVMHVFTQYWVHSDFISAAFDAMEMTASTKPAGRDLDGRTIDLQLQSQILEQRPDISDMSRQSQISEYIQFHPTTGWYTAPENASLVSEPCTAAMQHRLDRVVRHALTGYPEEEDLGRNGLHCLAESAYHNGLKRKRGGDAALITAVQALCSAGVDVDNYDLAGNTPLMAFITYPSSSKTIGEVIEILIHNGASVHRRNRNGETALHIAMRLGVPSAVEALLANHANVDARTNRGHSLLDIGTLACANAEQDYGRIMACMNIAMRYGAVMKPSKEMEWDERVNGHVRSQRKASIFDIGDIEQLMGTTF